MEKIFNNKTLFQLISAWKIHLIIISVISIIIGAFISSPIVITPKYKSTAIVYPTNISTYSKESETEQMFQIFLSTDIEFKMLDAFHLDKHYKLDRQDPLFVTYFLDEYNQNVSITKTEYESIQIQVFDKDPKIAADMVDSIIEFYNQKVAELHKRKQKEVMDIMGNAMRLKKNEIDSSVNQLTNMQIKFGILNYASQSSEVTRSMLLGNNKAKELYSNLEQYGGLYKQLDSLIWHFRKEYINYKWQYETAVREFNKNITYAQVVSKPFPADKKSYPVRWLIVALTLAGGLIISLIAIAFIESKKQKNIRTLESE
jgi:capsule polysaccharide export protein KpsE/RkpR